MDDSFAFWTTVPLRRQIDPRMMKAIVFGTLLVLGIGFFANWVITSERASLSRADRRIMRSGVEAGHPDAAADPGVSDEQAEKATTLALNAARVAFLEHRSFLDAGPAQLSALQRGYVFVDGPSTTSRIVSVASTADVWATAVQGPGGVCHWIRATTAGDVTRGTGSECTGAAALGPAAR